MTNIAQHQIFVYGSLRQGFRSPVYEYISRYFSFAGMAKVRGCLVDMGSYPAGVPVEDDHYIIGELYQVKDPAEFSWAIGQLDDYEGVNVEADEEQMYHRELAEVLRIKEQPLPGFTGSAETQKANPAWLPAILWTTCSNINDKTGCQLPQ
ncbi:MAG: gamma-glutamylcyclotransferase [Chitinophagaceae bacterium]|nr:gamma-glutamylcyclotransferase [Chitinophagaceae bacterium]